MILNTIILKSIKFFFVNSPLVSNPYIIVIKTKLQLGLTSYDTIRQRGTFQFSSNKKGIIFGPPAWPLSPYSRWIQFWCNGAPLLPALLFSLLLPSLSIYLQDKIWHHLEQNPQLEAITLPPRSYGDVLADQHRGEAEDEQWAN